MTGKHTPRTHQSLQETLDNYLALNSDYARVSTLMVGTQQVVGKTIYTCKAKIKEKLMWFDCSKQFYLIEFY
jgi:hypothetical protein